MNPRNPPKSTVRSVPSQARPTQAARSQAARSQAGKLHETLLLAQATSNLGRRKFIATLLALHESKLYFQLGSPSIEQYARIHFGIERSLTFEYLRVARSLRDLARSDEDFRVGKLSWTALREITKVATSDSEEEWIAFALKYPGARLKAEVREAVRKNRSTPRKEGYSLPSLETRLVFELKPEEQDLASKALEEAAREMGERLQGAEVELKDAFLFLARRFLKDRLDEDAAAGSAVNPETSLYTILYHKCPECRRASLPTPDGPVAIEAEVVERVEGDARRVVLEDSEPSPEVDGDGAAAEEEQPAALDRPNPPLLVRQVHLRDGRACSNPGCDRKHGLHAHHIVERARGGATAIYNEVLVCSTCHALLHAGLLRLQGSPSGGLAWTVPAREKSEDFWKRMNELNATSEVQVLESSPSESMAVDFSVKGSERFQVLVAALRTLGFSAAQAKRRLERAWESFGASMSVASDEDIVKRALRFSAA